MPVYQSVNLDIRYSTIPVTYLGTGVTTQHQPQRCQLANRQARNYLIVEVVQLLHAYLSEQVGRYSRARETSSPHCLCMPLRDIFSAIFNSSTSCSSR